MSPVPSVLGTVYLVGAGPGDPELLTLRAKSLLERAEAVVYDYLVDSSILKHCSPGVHLVDVGKRPSKPVDQEDINELLGSLARRYSVVVRLKGGDPFVFGRGGEEAAALTLRGIRFEVVPGVSSAIAVPAYAGVPVTHRGVAQGFLVITGHVKDGAKLGVNWEAVCALKVTLVVLMGVAHRAEIAAGLLGAGMDPSTPCLAGTWGTTSAQVSLRMRLDELAEAAVFSPAVIVVGGVAALDFSWFESRPLSGLAVVLTRAEEVDGRFSSKLRELGAEVIAAPVIAISPPSDGGKGLREAIGNLDSYTWVVFTSANAVRALIEGLSDLRVLGRAKIAAIGTGTANAIHSYRIGVDFTPSRFVGEALVEEFPSGTGKVLLPRARVAREVVPEGLAAKGWSVEVVEAYETTRPPALTEVEVLGRAHLVTFTSSSTVEGYLETYGKEALPQAVGVIGPITRHSAESRGIEITFEAEVHDLDGLVDATVAWWTSLGSHYGSSL